MKVYVDGQHGTTGLLVNERLIEHPEVELMTIPYNQRHDVEVRKKKLNEADFVFLCLPDEAAKEAVKLIENERTRIIDASTAHRIHEDWSYGFPEHSIAYRKNIIKNRLVANPGCHATAAISLIQPLVVEGIVESCHHFSFHSITGYTGGGKQMIADYETEDGDNREIYHVPRPYGMGLTHKHVPEIVKHTGLVSTPIMMPIVGPFPRGLAVTVPLFKEQLKDRLTKVQLVDFYRTYYAQAPMIHVHEVDDPSGLVKGMFDVKGTQGKNHLDLFIYGNEEQYQVISRIDNLGKGASGAAIQNMNIMMGIKEDTAL